MLGGYGVVERREGSGRCGSLGFEVGIGALQLMDAKEDRAIVCVLIVRDGAGTVWSKPFRGFIRVRRWGRRGIGIRGTWPLLPFRGEFDGEHGEEFIEGAWWGHRDGCEGCAEMKGVGGMAREMVAMEDARVSGGNVGILRGVVLVGCICREKDVVNVASLSIAQPSGGWKRVHSGDD